MASWNKRSQGTRQSARVRSTSRTMRTRQRFVSLELLEQRTLLSISNLVLASPLAPVEGQVFRSISQGGLTAANSIASFTDTNSSASPSSFSSFLSWGDGGFDQGIQAGGGILIVPESV